MAWILTELSMQWLIRLVRRHFVPVTFCPTFWWTYSPSGHVFPLYPRGHFVSLLEGTIFALVLTYIGHISAIS